MVGITPIEEVQKIDRLDMVCDRQGTKAIHVAFRAREMDPETLQALVSTPAGSDVLELEDYFGRNLFFFAVLRQGTEVLQYLLNQEIDLNALSVYNTSVLYPVIDRGDIEILEWVLGRIADGLIGVSSLGGLTPLKYAEEKAKMEMGSNNEENNEDIIDLLFNRSVEENARNDNDEVDEVQHLPPQV